MPYIKTIPPAEATGQLASSLLGGAPVDPVVGGFITRRQREMIATVVSATNKCSY